MTAAAARAVPAATAARFTRAISVALAAELLFQLFAALGAVRIFSVRLYDFFAIVTALGANKFY